MSGSDRQLYLSATLLDQGFLDFTSQDNLSNALEMACNIQTSTGTIRASDRNKYVGSTFYQALMVFPTITRKISHWLQNQIEFSSLSIEVSNVDGRFNHLELAGADFTSFVGKSIDVSIGLRDVAASYTTIFSGKVTEIGGAGRTIKSLTLTARDKFDIQNTFLPLTALTVASFPYLEPGLVGRAVPVIYGNYNEHLRIDPLTAVQKASVPAYCVNGLLAIPSISVPGSGRSNNAKFIISENANYYFDPTNVYILRSGLFTQFVPTDIVNVSGDNRFFEIIQDGGTVILPPVGTDGAGVAWEYDSGDTILVRVIGKNLAPSSNSNPVAIARDILKTYGGFTGMDFDANWATFEAKSSPAQSAIANIKARAWIQEVQSPVPFALSLLAQVRLEMYVSRGLLLKLNSQHFEEFVASPSFEVKNWDVAQGTFQPALDTQNNFNRAIGYYDKDPSTNETIYITGFFNNGAAIAQVGKQITKQIDYPNLYITSDVTNQIKETLRLASAGSELVPVTLTSRAFLLDLGDWVRVSVKIGSTVFDNVPAQIREISYDPAGPKLPMVLWSRQAVPFPGYTPGYAGIVGGYSATITAE